MNIDPFHPRTELDFLKQQITTLTRERDEARAALRAAYAEVTVASIHSNSVRMGQHVLNACAVLRAALAATEEKADV